MIILAIETSCDDTGIAILEVSKTGDFNVLSNIISSQIEVHKKYGGVYPVMAKREHQKNLVPTFKQALKQVKLLNPKSPATRDLAKRDKILNSILEREPRLLKKIIPFLKKYEKPAFDLIAVTEGPGLEPCLWVGINFARALSYFWDIPVAPVNHIESHILVNTIENKNIKFPAVALVVSGGHTQIVLVKKIGDYKILGETRDDAAGECFDKAAKILGLGYPGGPEIARLATGLRHRGAPRCRRPVKLPRPMINTKDYDFSFSGLKTAILYHHRKQPVKIQKSKKYIQEMATEIQQAVIDVLIKKTMKAVKDFKVKSLILGGGVSANEELRKQFACHCEQQRSNLNLIFPKPDLSTDNALMTAITGFFHQNKKIAWQKIKAEANLRIVSRSL